jgi:hypothetical protein
MMPNKSPEPAPCGAVAIGFPSPPRFCSPQESFAARIVVTVAVRSASRVWLSFVRQAVPGL